LRLAHPDGPSVVAVGGGHGLSASLRAIRRYAGEVTAIVSVADDGGSSGRLRQALPDLLAPGDVRRCLGALADERSALGRALEHRFGDEGSGGDLAGHALGNLLLVALAHELGSFGAAVDELVDQLRAVGRVLPATAVPVALEGAAAPDGPAAGGAAASRRVVGQVAVQNTPGLRRLQLRPADAASDPAVAESLRDAHQVVLGPGSLFTSVLAAAIVPAVREALAATSAQRVYVANLAPQVPETAGFSVDDELAALASHGIEVDVVVVDPRRTAGAAAPEARVVVAPVADPDRAVHDPERLAVVLGALAPQPPT
jgi:uncharacterized cofD-like protein